MEIICPRPAALPTVNKVSCPENLGQIQRFLFQRAGFVFDSTGSTDIKLLASWTPLFIATGDTKVVSTPVMANVVIPRGEAKVEGGGDNTTIDGVELVVGVGPITLTGDLISVPAKVIKQLKSLFGEENLVVYMINQYGEIIAHDNDPAATGTLVTGLQISGRVFASDAGNEGLNTLDKATLRFSFAEGWRDQLVKVKGTDFNAKTGLFPPA